MNENDSLNLPADFEGFCSPNSVDVILDGPGDTTPGPLPPSLLAWAEYERDRSKNPTKPASMPRPGSKPPARTE